ncbi:fimbrial protein [Enterobacter cloacae complex sp. ESBL7]|uniref:fimbrial protein n=1 Tax=Enterobacter cloacae complex sp. ESBL7 TaxID=3163325 RepID=UPI0035624B87
MGGKGGLNDSRHKCRRLRKVTLTWLGLLLASQASDVAAGNQGVFKAEITPATCSVALDSGKDSISLGIYDTSKLTDAAVITKPLLSSDDAPQALKLTCAGLPSASLMPTLTLNGDASSANKTMFRTPGAGDDTTPSLGIRVQLRKSSDISSWDTIDYMSNQGTFSLDDTGSVVPVRFTMWCIPVSGQTYVNCKETGKVAARLTFSFDYQ